MMDKPQPYETLVASPATLRLLARTLRKKKKNYMIKRVVFDQYNPAWNSRTGLALEVTRAVYLSLF